MAAITSLIGVGGASNFSLRLGEENKEDASRYVGNSLLAGLITGLVICAVVLLNLEPLLVLFGARDAVLEYAAQYTRIYAFGIPFHLIVIVGGQLVTADGSPRYSMAGMLSGAILNIILEPIFIFAFDMGMKGAALATIIGEIVRAGIILLYFRRFKSVALTKEFFRPQLRILKGIVCIGAAASLNQIAVTIFQITFNNVLGHYGELSIYGRDIPLAVVGIGHKLSIVVLSVIAGVAQSSQPIVGFNYGAKNYPRVKKTYKTAAATVVAIGTVAFAVFQLFPKQMIGLFGGGSELYFEFGIKYLRIYQFFIFVNGIQTLSASFFSSIGKLVKGIVISLSKQLVLLLPLIVFLPMLMGVEGVLYAGPIADFGTFVVASALSLHEMKKMGK